MNYKETLMMPSSFSSVTDEEMEYLDGGKPINLPMDKSYLKKSACRTKAEWLLTYGYCNNMDVLDVAKEIYGHAIAYYKGTSLANSYPALSGFFNSIASHGANGIALEDHKDKKWAWAFEITWLIPD